MENNYLVINNNWNPLVFKQVKEVGESIEMIYTQTSMISNLKYENGQFQSCYEERAVKIIYSCKNGKWNKSEPIYGKIIEESYCFEKNHTCKYCGIETHEPDENCYKNPNN